MDREICPLFFGELHLCSMSGQTKAVSQYEFLRPHVLVLRHRPPPKFCSYTQERKYTKLPGCVLDIEDADLGAPNLLEVPEVIAATQYSG